MHHLKLDEGDTHSVEEVVASLQGMSEVEYAEPNYIVDKMDTGVPQIFTLDQIFEATSSAGFAMTHAQIQVTPTWQIVTSGAPGSVVAVIDTGLDITHPSFSQAVWVNSGEIPANGIDDDRNGYVDDVNGWNFVANNNSPNDDEGHGTHVSGIVLGVSQNIFATPTAPANIRVMPLKFLDANGSGATSDAIKAIYYAVNNGAKVMNNSWGGGNFSQALAEAIAYAYSKDVLFVAAAGNASTNNDASPTFPANYNVPNLVSVAASDDSDRLANFSNYGAQTVHLSSPGVNILSTYPGGLYAYLSGTSMASPFAAGTAALMRYANPQMNVYQIRKLLLSSVDPVSNLGGAVQTSGRVDVLNAVTAAQITPIDNFKPNFALSVDPNDRGLASSIAGRGTGCGAITTKFGPEGNRHVRVAIIALALMLIPILVWIAMRAPEAASNRRRFDRFAIDTSVKFRIGDEELVGSVRTISMGGSDLNTEALLKNGSVITMTISSPDGRSKIDVEGNIVWSDERKRYGVQFREVDDSIKSSIASWTKGLVKI